MKLSKAQILHIKERREWMDQREKDIRSIGEANLYKSSSLCNELGKINMEHSFFNHMIKLHNVELKAEKEALKAFENEVAKVMKDD